MLDWALLAARLLQFGSGLVLFGLSLFYLYARKAGSAYVPSRPWARGRVALLLAAVSALVGVVWWLFVQRAVFFPEAAPFDAEPISILLMETGFGRVALFRMGVLVASIGSLLAFRPGTGLWTLQAVLGGLLAASFAWTGHGVFDEGVAGVVHTTADVLHLLAAGVWIGALIGLSILIFKSLRDRTVTNGVATLYALERFSSIGLAVVGTLVLTGIINSWFLIGLPQWHTLFTTTYGLLLVFKLSLLGAMLGLAASNRFVLSPRLRSVMENSPLEKDPAALEGPLRALRRSVVAETALAAFVLAVVAYLGTLEPPISEAVR